MKPQPVKRKLHSSRLRTRLSLGPKILLWMTIVCVTAIGCGWPGTQHSVRFNDYQTEREMGRLPPMPTLANGLNELRAFWEMEDLGSDEYERAETRSKEVDGLWDRAAAAEQDGDLRADRKLLSQYVEHTAIAREIWFEPKDCQPRRNSAIDRLDALKELDRGVNAMRVSAYLNARRAHDTEKPNKEEIQQALEQAAGDPNLRDNVAYLNAAELYAQGDYAEAAKAFGAVARRYPRSEKREGAIFMSGVSLMKTSANFDQHDEVANSTDDRAGPSAKPKVTLDEAGDDAMAAFRRLIKENPRGRFTNDARGWVAYLMLHSNDRAGALVEYYRLLGDKHDENARIEAAFSLRLVRGRATEEDMARVERALESEPEAALAYAYHNIYNYAIDPSPDRPPYEEVRDSLGNIDYEAGQARAEENDKQWQNERAMAGRREMARVLDFSKRLFGSYPHIAAGGGFALRAAQASLELGDNESAVQFARRAIQAHVAGDECAQALWTGGIAEYRLRHFDVARRTLSTLLAEYPSGDLVESARRMQAMIAEDSGDIDAALEQYLTLGYHLDVAYFVDVLMTIDQLAAFIRRHPDSPKINELVYALGVRYLRANRWEDARQTFARVRITGTRPFSIFFRNSKCQYGNVEPGCDDPKEPEFDDEHKPIITARLLMHDVQTANDLEALERNANEAEGDEAKAEALYQLASYQFEASSLLFYNPIAWTGSRYWNLSQLAGQGRYRLANESQILWNYMQEHDRLARALKIYLEVVKRFPRTRAARDALYTAAVCHERLSNSNPYWRDAYEAGLHAGERMVTYVDVKSAYPNYQLPQGTYSWEPATRTVDGGPGWSAPPKPPKPKPRPTRLARIKQLLLSALRQVEQFWEQTARRLTVILMLIAATLIVARFSSITRKLWRHQVGSDRPSDSAPAYRWISLFRVDPVEMKAPEKAKLLLRTAGKRMFELAIDPSSRPVLAMNVFAHGLFAWILSVLLWTICVG